LLLKTLRKKKPGGDFHPHAGLSLTAEDTELNAQSSSRSVESKEENAAGAMKEQFCSRRFFADGAEFFDGFYRTYIKAFPMTSPSRLFVFLCLLTTVAVAAIKAPGGQFKNLEILPKDISPEKLDSIMNSYNRALGIGCSFCHASHPTIADSLDYASDKNEMKINARGMMKLTIDINQKYFYYDSLIPPVYLNIVNCKTCHRGEPYPVE
jgi:hypothetical protein